MRKLARAVMATGAAISVVLTASAFSAPRAAAARGPATPGGPMAAAARTGGPPAGTRTIDSYNWAGYAVARAGLAFRSVRAAFFVPYADCRDTPGASSSHWVGLDGLGSSSVEQIGVAVSCAGTKPRYYAWYEMYPKASRWFSGCIPEMPFRPVCVISRPAGNSCSGCATYPAGGALAGRCAARPVPAPGRRPR